MHHSIGLDIERVYSFYLYKEEEGDEDEEWNCEQIITFSADISIVLFHELRMLVDGVDTAELIICYILRTIQCATKYYLE